MCIKSVGPVLIDIAMLLMSSGANTQRVRTTIKRISEAFKLESEVLLTHQSIHLYLKDPSTGEVFQQLKKSFVYSNNLEILSGISHMSWKVVEEGWSLPQVQNELKRLSALKRYPLPLVFLMVSLAGAAFCRLFGGGPLAMLTVFGATLIGLFVRHQTQKNQFNPYLSIYLASIASTLTSIGLNQIYPSMDPKHTLPAALLFLVPGIPLINSFSDFVDGNILNGWLRSINSLLMAFSITLGFLTAMVFLLR